jgi:hypothetical protein
MAPIAARDIISDANIGAIVHPSNLNPRRTVGGGRTVLARTFARWRSDARNLVAQKLARCGSTIFACFRRGKLDCAHEFKLNPLLDSCQYLASRKSHAPLHTAIPVGCHPCVASPTKFCASPSGRALGASRPESLTAFGIFTLCYGPMLLLPREAD